MKKLTLGACLFAVTLPGCAKPSGAGTPETLTIDHAARSVEFQGETIDRSEAILVSDMDDLIIQVTNTAEALYSVTVAAEAIDAPFKAAIDTFLGTLGPYALDLSGEFGLAEMRRPECVSDLQTLDGYVDSLLLGEARVRKLAAPLRDHATTAEVMVASNVATDSMGSAAGLTDALTSLYSRLADEFPGADPACQASIRKALDAAPKVIGRSRALETAVSALADSDGTWEASGDSLDLPPVGLAKGARLTIAIAATENPLLAWAATRAPLTVKVEAQRKSRLGLYPVVGLSLTWARDAEFSTFAGAELSDSTVVVSKADLDDYRLNYALNLGFETAPLGRLPGLGTVRWVPIQFLASPSEDIRAIGVGTGVRVGVLRLDLGAQWFKRQVLTDDQQVGQVLEGVAVQTARRYGSPEAFIGVSLTGWKPFSGD